MELKSKIENIIKAAIANPGTETRYHDKNRCFRLLRENAKAFSEFNQLTCGKCATGPCALKSR